MSTNRPFRPRRVLSRPTRGGPNACARCPSPMASALLEAPATPAYCPTMRRQTPSLARVPGAPATHVSGFGSTSRRGSPPPVGASLSAPYLALQPSCNKTHLVRGIPPGLFRRDHQPTPQRSKGMASIVVMWQDRGDDVAVTDHLHMTTWFVGVAFPVFEVAAKPQRDAHFGQGIGFCRVAWNRS
jgi:hypothetical protein